jgi:long-chain acyl-CoA synthetase
MNDMAYIDNGGYVFLMGRSDDVINIGGEKVSPVEIENSVSLFPGIKECCCISVADPGKILENVPVVFVVLNDKKNYTGQNLYEHLGQHLEKYKLPYKIVVIEKIPRNSIGKFLRRELAVMWQNAESFGIGGNT